MSTNQKLKYGQELQTGAHIFEHNGVHIYHVNKDGAPMMYWYTTGELREVGDFDVRLLPLYKEKGQENPEKSGWRVSHAAIIQDAIDRGIIV